MPLSRAGGRRLAAIIVAAVIAVVVAALAAAFLLLPPSGSPVVASPQTERAPSVLYVVVDDLSSDVVPYMSEVGALAAEGVSFDNFFVTDSQCCPSRASTLTGTYPHNNRVRTNTWPTGGFGVFLERHLEDSMGPALAAAGYRTGFVGKFLNGYRPEGSRHRAAPGTPTYERGFVPPGWDEWHVVGAGYPNFDYSLAEAVDEPVAEVEKYGHAPEDYLTDVLSDKASGFLERAAEDEGPFFLTVAPFAVHSGAGRGPANKDVDFPAAPRDRAVDPGQKLPPGWSTPDFTDGDCGAVDGGCDAVPFPPPGEAETFNTLPTNGNRWLPNRPLDSAEVQDLREKYLDRIRMAQAVNDMIVKLRADLDRLELSDSTYIVFTSDNGYHLGDHGLPPGKNSIYDQDIRVPMIIVPPGGTTPAAVDAIGQNVDLLPTFLDLAGAARPGRTTDGRSLLPLVSAPEEAVAGWRDGALVEFTHDDSTGDPDRESRLAPPTYRAVRTSSYVYVDYGPMRDEPGDRTAEFYDLANDPAATENRYPSLSTAEKRALDKALDRYADCSRNSCAAAARHLPQISTAGR